MGFDLGGTGLVSSGGLAVMSGANPFLRMTSTGLFRRYTMQPMFRAGNSGTAANPAYGVANWVRILFNATNVNVGSSFNTSNGAFTAPVAGIYLLSGTVYMSIAAAGGYAHGMFWVNGSATLRRPGGPMHRLDMHGIAAGYSADVECTEILTMLAGDYVQFYNYSNDVNNTLNPQYSHFEGYMLG